jgi:sarcosine oxidase
MSRQIFSRHSSVFGSHYDEGRITRSFDSEAFWRQLNCAAISRYGEISAESRGEFYREAGVLHVGPSESTEIASVGKIAAEAGILCEAYDDTRLAERCFDLYEVAAELERTLQDFGFRIIVFPIEE